MRDEPPTEDLFNKMERMMKEFQDFSQQLPSTGRFFPTDIQDKEEELVLQAEMPGVSKEDIRVKISGNTVSIYAESDEKLDAKKEDYFRRERRQRSYKRSFKLPETVEIDEDDIKASYRQGVLELRLPKKTEKQEKEIKVE